MNDSFFPNQAPPPVEPVKLPGFAWRLYIFVTSLISDVWRLALSFTIASMVYLMYTIFPFNVLAWLGSIVLLYRFGAYTIIVQKNKVE